MRFERSEGEEILAIPSPDFLAPPPNEYAVYPVGRPVFGGIRAKGKNIWALDLWNLERNQAVSLFHEMLHSFPHPDSRIACEIRVSAGVDAYNGLREWIMEWTPAPWILDCFFKARKCFGPESMLEPCAPRTLIPLDLLAFKGAPLVNWEAVCKEGGWEFWFTLDTRASKSRAAALRDRLAQASGVPDLFDRSQEFWNEGDLG